MSEAILPFSNVFSPYGGPKLYVGRENKGFIVKPTSDSATDGWGEPRIDEKGASLTPGTPGGANPYKFLGYRSNKGWGCRHTPGNQLYGNVSWLGKLKKPTVDKKGKWVLTFHGPNTRYFPTDSFSYGSSDTHNNIYCEGICIAVAPYPVLGAALRRYTNPITSRVESSLVVICHHNSQDIVMLRRVDPASGANAETYGDTFRSESMKMFDEERTPNGWRLLGAHACTSSGQGTSRKVKGPRTPWFFDSTGTVAQCMREADITFNRGDKEVTQAGYVRYKITVGDSASSLSVPDNTEAFTITTTHTAEQLEDYSAITYYPYYSSEAKMHWWHTYRIRATVEGVGQYVVAVDYVDTVESLLVADLRISRSTTEWIHVGYDADNLNDIRGDTWKSRQDGYIPAQNNGVTSIWFKVDDSISLRGNGLDSFYLYRRLLGTKSEFLTGVSDPTDPWAYFCDDLLAYPHYVSIPRPHISCYTKFQSQQLENRYLYLSEEYKHNGAATTGRLTTYMEKQMPPTTVTYGTQVAVNCGWLYSDFDAYWKAGVSTSHTFKSIDGKYPVDFTVPAAVEPSYPSGLYNTKYDYLGFWPTLQEVLQSSANYRDGQMAEDSLGNFLASIKYSDENGNEKYYNVLNGATGRLDGLTAASGKNTRYYPLGEV